MSISRIIAAVVIALITAHPALVRADESEATFTPQGGGFYPRLQPSQVVIYVYKPDFKFKVIGVVEARGLAGGGGSLLDQLDILGRLTAVQPTEKDDIRLAMKALQEEAAAAGAEGVIIIQSQQVRVSQTTTERRIRAAAIVKVE